MRVIVDMGWACESGFFLVVCLVIGGFAGLVILGALCYM